MIEPTAPDDYCTICGEPWGPGVWRSTCPHCRTVMCANCAGHPAGCPSCGGAISNIVTGEIPVPETKLKPIPPHDVWLEQCRQFRLANEPPDVVSLTLTWGGPGTGVGYAGGVEDHEAVYMLETALRKLRTSIVLKAVAADYERAHPEKLP